MANANRRIERAGRVVPKDLKPLEPKPATRGMDEPRIGPKGIKDAIREGQEMERGPAMQGPQNQRQQERFNVIEAKRKKKKGSSYA